MVFLIEITDVCAVWKSAVIDRMLSLQKPFQLIAVKIRIDRIGKLHRKLIGKKRLSVVVDKCSAAADEAVKAEINNVVVDLRP